MLGSDAGVVESGGDGVGVDHVAHVGLEEHRLRAVEDAEAAAVDGGGVFAGGESPAAGLDADELHVGVVDEACEEAHCVRAAADAGDGLVGQPAVLVEALPARLASDDALEVAHHFGIGGGAGDGADHVEGVVAVRDPVAEGLVHRVLERGASLLDGVDRGAEHLHAGDVRRLAGDVDGPHVDVARHAEEGGDRGRGDAVHAGAGLGDQPPLAHAPGEERLSDGVVHLVGAGVVEVLALQEDSGAAEVVRESSRVGERALASDVVPQDFVELPPEGGVVARRLVGGLKFPERLHQGFGDILSAVWSVVSLHSGQWLVVSG